MPNDPESFSYDGTLTRKEVTALLANVFKCQPEEIRGWLIIAHTHPINGHPYKHATNTVSNMPDDAIPTLIADAMRAIHQ